MNIDSFGPGAAISARELLGPIRQVGYVVDDVEASAAGWLDRFGIGPWRIKHGIRFTDCVYDDTPIDIEISLASAYSGEAEVKLIAQTAGPPSIYADFLEAGPGAQHVCFYPTDFPAAVELFSATGSAAVMRGVIGNRDFVYFDDGNGQVVELVDIEPASIEARGDRIAAAAEWDGSDPIVVVAS